MSASEPPEVPEPEVEYRRPAWVEPPADLVPGIVPVELILARTPQRAIGLTGIRAYPTGFGSTLHLRLREVIGEQSTFGAFDMFGDAVDPAGEFALYCHGGGGSERGWRSRHWLWGLPPTGPLAFVCTWPAGQLQASSVEIDASLVLEAANRALPVWATG